MPHPNSEGYTAGWFYHPKVICHDFGFHATHAAICTTEAYAAACVCTTEACTAAYNWATEAHMAAHICTTEAWKAALSDNDSRYSSTHVHH